MFSKRFALVGAPGGKGIEAEKENADRGAGAERGVLDQRKPGAARAKRDFPADGGESRVFFFLFFFLQRLDESTSSAEEILFAPMDHKQLKAKQP